MGTVLHNPAGARETIQGSPIFYPLNAPLHALTNKLDSRREKNPASMQNHIPSVAVGLRIRLSNEPTEETLEQLEGVLPIVAYIDFTDFEVVRLGRADLKVERSGSSWLFTIYVDACVWHELDEHDAIVWAGFVNALPEFDAQLLNVD